MAITAALLPGAYRGGSAGTVETVEMVAAASFPGEVVLPPLYGSEAPRVSFVEGSPAGVAWLLNGTDDRVETVRYTAFGGPAGVDSGLSGDEFALAGSRLSSFRQSTLVSQTVDIGTGRRTTRTQEHLADHPVVETADGWLDWSRNQLVYTVAATGVSRVYPRPVVSGVDPAYRVEGGPGDIRGTFMYVQSYPSPVWSWQYLDFGTGEVTVLEESTDFREHSVYLTDHWVYTLRTGVLRRVPRDDLSAAPQTMTVGRVAHLAVHDDAVALARRAPTADPAEPSVITVWSGRWGGPLTQVTGGPAPGWAVQVNNGDFGVVAGKTATDIGIYRLHPGDAAFAGVIAKFGPSAPLGVEASAGRFLAVSGATPNTRPVYQRAISSGPGLTSLQVGPRALLGQSSDRNPPSSSGGHTAFLRSTGTSALVVVLNGSTEIARYPVPRESYRATLSGQWLLVTQFALTTTTEGTAVMINLDTGARVSVPQTTALWAGRVAYLRRNGEIRLRLVRTGSERILRPAGLPVGTSSLRPATSRVWLHGDWALWMLKADDGSTAEMAAVNLSTGRRADLTASAPSLGAMPEVELADGVVAWIDHADRSVHVYRLADRVDTVIGSSQRRVDNRRWLALTDEFVAYVAADDSTRIVPLGAVADASPRFLGGLTPPAFSPDGNRVGDYYRPQLDTSRPLGAWTMTIRGPAGHIVRILRGSAPRGAIRPSWGGRSGTGKRLRDGRYTWFLTGTGPGGKLARADGSTGPISGTVWINTR